MTDWTIVVLLVALCLTGSATAQPGEIIFETRAFAWRLSPDGRTVSLRDKPTNRELCAAPSQPAFILTTGAGIFVPAEIALAGDVLTVRFAENAGECRFTVAAGDRHLLLRLQELKTTAPLERLTLCRLFTPREGKFASVLNAWRGPDMAVALMGLSPNVCPGETRPLHGSASPGATAKAGYAGEAQVGKGAARLVGLNPTEGAAWTFWPRRLPRPLDLRGHVGIGAWVKGDGKGELLKIQLHDSTSGDYGHYRDYYITIDFTGWKYCELPRPVGEAIDYSDIVECNLYFNGIPAKTDVACLVDDIRALRKLTGQPSTDPTDWVLESFEDPSVAYFDRPATVLSADCLAQYGTEGAGVALIACPDRELGPAIAEMELAAGLPSPRLKGAWGKTSPEITRSYLFIFGMGMDNVDVAINYARQCGFGAILIGDACWTRGYGHFTLNTDAFPRGIPDLRATVARIHAAGFRCGLHFLAAGISANDRYVTPVPDNRLVMDRFAELAGDVDEKAAVLPTVAAPEGFPPQEGGYTGDSAIVRIGDELVSYGSRSLKAPCGFRDCRRGDFGTTPAAHKRGDRIAHVRRGYGLFLHDIDTTLTAEVARNFADVANAVDADMAYFDGSEGMQEPHWYYNARLHKAYWDALGRNDVLLQGSSHSHYSWHIVSRAASADGHGDLKRYLDERIPGFAWLADNLMPLDLGWYYIYGAQTTPDQIEYICQKALGFGCSVSIQTDPGNITGHPRMDEIIKLLRTYEDLRLAGTVPEAMRARLRVPGEEYRLSMEDGKPHFRRVVYGKETLVTPGAEPVTIPIRVDRALGTPRLGVELRAGGQMTPGAEYDAPGTWLLEDFEDLAPYGVKDARPGVGTDLAGSTSPGVTQRLESASEGAKLGGHCARYTAVSTRSDNNGWSAVGRVLDPAPDLREHVGLGVWICGDGSGAKFKIQPRDAATHAQDYYISIDFTGWRYFILPRPEKPWPEPIVYDAVKSLTFYFNNIPAGKTCTVLVDGLKALRSIAEVPCSAPELVGPDGSVLGFDASLGRDCYLLYSGGAAATVKAPRAPGREVPVTGRLGALPDGASTITVRPSAHQTRELFVKTMVVYD